MAPKLDRIEEGKIVFYDTAKELVTNTLTLEDLF